MKQPELSEHERGSRTFFDDWSKDYDDKRISPWFQYTQQMAIDALDLRPDSRVLDVGCGTGYATLRVASLLPEGRACGLDISPGMVEAARRKIPPALAERATFVEGSAAALPFPRGSFTHALCTNSFHHYPDPIAALEGIARVLVPGGQLVIFENAPDLSLYTWAWDRFLRIFEKGHVRYIPSRELGQMFEAAGYVDRELLVLRNEFRKHGKLYASIQLWSARTPSGPPAGDAAERADAR